MNSNIILNPDPETFDFAKVPDIVHPFFHQTQFQGEMLSGPSSLIGLKSEQTKKAA